MCDALATFPGGDLVSKGIRDLRGERESPEARLVSLGRPRLEALGLHVPAPFDAPELRLYELLARDEPDAAHGRYNALVRRLVSFQRAFVMRRLVDAERIRRFIRDTDPYTHALAKLERGHARDVEDVAAMQARGLVASAELLERYAQIEPELYRFPAIDPSTFRSAVVRAVS